MRTNIDIDDQLMAEAMSFNKKITKKQLLENALHSYINAMKRKEMLELFGKVQWEGNLQEMRTNEGEKISI